MALYRGGLGPSAIYRGDQPVSAVYRGDTEVWPVADRYDYLESGVLDLLVWSDVEYVIVAGGGGGGGSSNSIRGAGGGGAGGVLTGTVTLPPGTYPISVGAGGAGGAAVTGATGASGGNSTFAEMVAIGGGGASVADNGGGRDGQPGGSGAGGSAQAGLGGAGTPGQGHPGGTATGGGLGRGGAGGGGAGGPGQDGASNAPGLGGAGISVGGRTYAAGGRGGHTGGGGTQNPGDGGQGAYGQGNGWDGAGGIVALKVSALPTVTVTPQAPTFLTESPWVTLPTQTGVTYSVTGTPGYGQTVTVTATPQAGYALAGQTSWTHTYGPAPSIYPVSGTWGPISLTRYKTTEVASHTVVESGNFTFTAPGIPDVGLRLYRNGNPVRVGTTGAALSQAIALAVGDIVSLRVYPDIADPLSGSWSIVKN